MIAHEALVSPSTYKKYLRNSCYQPCGINVFLSMITISMESIQTQTLAFSEQMYQKRRNENALCDQKNQIKNFIFFLWTKRKNIFHLHQHQHRKINFSSACRSFTQKYLLLKKKLHDKCFLLIPIAHHPHWTNIAVILER